MTETRTLTYLHETAREEDYSFQGTPRDSRTMKVEPGVLVDQENRPRTLIKVSAPLTVLIEENIWNDTIYARLVNDRVSVHAPYWANAVCVGEPSPVVRELPIKDRRSYAHNFVREHPVFYAQIQDLQHRIVSVTIKAPE